MSVHSQVPSFLAALCAVGALAFSPVALAAASAGDKPATASGTTVFRCAAGGAAPIFSDAPCPGAAGAQPWRPPTMAQGIVRSSGPAGLPSSRTANPGPAARDDPFVDCRRRGGRLDVASRICHLPDDAARAMFRHY
ncbi:MAG: hypothetical protein AB7L76_17345 [Burkholderiaceae bacterium]